MGGSVVVLQSQAKLLLLALRATQNLSTTPSPNTNRVDDDFVDEVVAPLTK